jgi:hypothetical protein
VSRLWKSGVHWIALHNSVLFGAVPGGKQVACTCLSLRWEYCIVDLFSPHVGWALFKMSQWSPVTGSKHFTADTLGGPSFLMIEMWPSEGSDSLLLACDTPTWGHQRIHSIQWMKD